LAALTVDPMAVAAQVVTNLQHVVSRNTDARDAAIVSVTKIVGGTAFNVIPDKAEMEGTMRAFDEEVREKVPELMERVVKGVADAHGASFSFEYYRGPDPVVNDEEVARVVEETARELFGEEAVEAPAPTMGRTSRLTSELLRRLSSWWARRTKRRASPTRITTRASTSTRTPCPSA
jgi:metal-dependent amidase/aminoacylase/carboxypeptidase family protein